MEKSTLNEQEVMAIAYGNLVEDAPEEFIRLPRPPMLMIDRVTEISHNGNRGRIVAEKDVRPDDWFFHCHFSGDPVQPGCLGVDAIWQLIGLYCGIRGGKGSGRALGCKEVEFMGQIRPYDQQVRYEIDMKRVRRGKLVLGIADGRVYVDGEHVYTATDMRVGLKNMDQPA